MTRNITEHRQRKARTGDGLAALRRAFAGGLFCNDCHSVHDCIAEGQCQRRAAHRSTVERSEEIAAFG